MRILYYDCFSGISGDMNLGAMIDLGIEETYLKEELEKLNLEGYTLKVTKDQRKGITGTRVDVRLHHHHHHHDEHKDKHQHEHEHEHEHEHYHRNIKDIEKIINQSSLSDKVKSQSMKMFKVIAEAEAKIHGKLVEEIHFHEVGAIDSIVDIVGSAICFEKLNVDKVIFSTISLGSGFVNCAHGRFPVPAPATVEILKGIKVTSGEVKKEMTTPTGAAIARVCADAFSDQQDFYIQKIGYGLGKRDNVIPNVLRVFLGENEVPSLISHLEKKVETVIECNIDDQNPEIYQHIINRLLGKGAKDAWITPIVMKKGRSAVTLSVLIDQVRINEVLEILFNETSTFGVRYYPVEKYMLDRRIEKMDTPYGQVRIKIGFLNDKEIKHKLEYEDCKKIAEAHDMPLTKVYDIVNQYYFHHKSKLNT